MENARALEQALREQFEVQFAEKERNMDKRGKREIDKIRAEYKHLKEQDDLEHESILYSFKAFHKQNGRGPYLQGRADHTLSTLQHADQNGHDGPIVSIKSSTSCFNFLNSLRL